MTDRRIIAALQVSVDGLIEGREGEVDWIESWEDSFDLFPQIDTCILGGGMYPGYEEYWLSILAAVTTASPTPPLGRARSECGRLSLVDPVTIDVDRKHAVTIAWEDGHVSRFPLEFLRASCMCAQCRGLRDQGKPAWAPTGGAGTLQVESARQVGNWGLNLHWNDGHTTGIFTWEVLRAWCLCDRCSGS